MSWFNDCIEGKKMLGVYLYFEVIPLFDDRLHSLISSITTFLKEF